MVQGGSWRGNKDAVILQKTHSTGESHPRAQTGANVIKERRPLVSSSTFDKWFLLLDMLREVIPRYASSLIIIPSVCFSSAGSCSQFFTVCGSHFTDDVTEIIMTSRTQLPIAKFRGLQPFTGTRFSRAMWNWRPLLNQPYVIEQGKRWEMRTNNQVSTLLPAAVSVVYISGAAAPREALSRTIKLLSDLEYCGHHFTSYYQS